MEETKNSVVMLLMITACNPLQLIKSRIQTMNQMIFNGIINKKYDGIIDCFKTTKNVEGPKALWKGNSITLIRYYPNELMNNKVKNIVQTWLPQSVLSKVISGICGGWVSAGILYPFDMIRIYISTSITSQKQSVKKFCTKIGNQGILCLYKGYSGSLLGIALFRGSFFGCYDSLKTKGTTKTHKWLSAYLAGLMGSIAVYPVETIRKNMIIGKNNTNSLITLKQIFRRDGIRGLYKGCSLIPIQSLVGAQTLIYFDSTQLNKTH